MSVLSLFTWQQPPLSTSRHLGQITTTVIYAFTPVWVTLSQSLSSTLPPPDVIGDVWIAFLFEMHKSNKAPFRWRPHPPPASQATRWKNWKVAQSEFPWPQFDHQSDCLSHTTDHWFESQIFLVSGLIRVIRFDRKLLSFRLVSDLFSPLHDHHSTRSDCHFLQWRIGLDCSYYEVDLFLWMIDLLSLLAGCLAIGEGYWRVNFIICAKVM